MVLNGKEDNMLIGDPYKFAVLFKILYNVVNIRGYSEI